MKSTNNFGLQKPEPLIDNVNIDVINGNMDVVDAALNNISKFETAGGTPTAITLNGIVLANGLAKTFIVSANNNGGATTINGKPIYSAGTSNIPVLIAGHTVTIWYDTTKGCFYASPSHDTERLAGQLPAYYQDYNNLSNKPTSLPANGGTALTISETLPLNKGGTGQTSAAAARNALGLGNTTGALPVANGGTGATDAATARINLGVAPLNSPVFTGVPQAPTGATDYTTSRLRNVRANTTDLIVGSSALASGDIYLVYE